jgi:WD40 repeat protein/tRNA A-37 threonylcarbamoyl transferase component Bud32
MSADLNLLFGVLALQADFLDAQQFAAACSEWATRKDSPLADLVVERGWLTPEDRADVERLLERKLRKHGGDVRASLAAMATLGVRSVLESVADPDVRQSLADLTPPACPALPSTVAYKPGSRQRYTLTRLHAQGGIGQVWLAHDEDLGRDVALKELRPDSGDSATAVARFLEEAKITGQLEHPGVVPVYELVQPKDGHPCYAMRFVGGRTLADAIQDYHRKRQAGEAGPLDLRGLLTAFVSVCQAVAYAHSRGVLHRDLKPQNVGLGEYGEVLVLDWGLAKVLGQAEDPTSLLPVALGAADGAGLTQQGQVLGTPAYMAPEQARGRPDLVDKRSDVYGLGAILFEVLTGQPPFTGPDTPEVLKRVAQEPPVRPRQCVPATPRALEAICLKALAKKPEERYSSARDLARDVERWLADESVSAHREPWTARSRRWLGRHRTLVTAASVGLLVTVVGLAVGLVLLGAANGRERQAKHREEAARSAAESQRDEARRNLYISHMHLAKRAWDDADMVRLLELLRQHQPTSGGGDPDLRGWEWYYLWRLCHTDPLTLTGHTGPIFSVCWSPDGQRLASAGGVWDPQKKRYVAGEVKVWDQATGRAVLSLRGHTREVTCVCWSPDGQRLASASSDQTVKVWEAATGREVLALKGHTGALRSVCWSPDGKRLASAGYGVTVKVWDAETGQEALALKRRTGPVYSVCWSPDGKRLAGARTDNTVTLWDTEKGQEVLTLRGHTSTVLNVCFSPDGRRLASASHDGTVRVWGAQTGQEALTLKGHTGGVDSGCWSPDGQRLASASSDRTVKVWDAARGQEALTLKGHTDKVTSVCWSPDGKRLASAGRGELGKPDEVKVWDAAKEQEALSLKGHTDQVTSVCWRPDGKRLASASWDQTVKVWDAHTGQEALTLKGHIRGVLGVCFRPDGRRLASASFDQTVKVWDAQTGQETVTLQGHAGPVYSVCWSPDGKRLASAGDDGTVKVWDAANGQEALSLQGHTNAVNAVCYSPDGKGLASASYDNTVKVWDAQTGQETRTLQGHTSPVLSVCFSPDGRRLATASWDGTVKVWEAETGQEALTLKGHTSSVHSVCWSPDGQRLASASHDRMVKVWDAANGQEVLTLKGHTSAVLSVCWSPDGQRLTSAGSDQTVKVWDARTGQEAQ